MNKKILDFYIKVGSNLESKGINEFVMPLELIQDFFVLCNDEKILILGGDIYEKLQDGQFVATYDNWYYEGYNFSESIEMANIYLNKLNEENLYVSFILNNELFILPLKSGATSEAIVLPYLVSYLIPKIQKISPKTKKKPLLISLTLPQ